MRWLLLALMGVYLLAACGMLVVRYAILPNIDEWRPLIERNLSSALDLNVRIKSVSADWSGLNPTLSVRNLSVSNAEGQSLLEVPGAYAAVSWRSILVGGLRLSRLELDGLSLSAARLADGRISIAGHIVDPTRQERLEINSGALAVSWLLGQGVIQSRGTTIRWNDALRQAPELVLSDVDLELSNGLFSHRLAVRADVPPEVGKSVEFAVRADHVLQRLGSKANRDAEVYIELQDIDPQALRAWVDLPEVAGRYAARAWIDVQQGRFGQAIVDIAARGVGLPIAGTLPGNSAQAEPVAPASTTDGNPVATAGNQAATAEQEPIAFFADNAQVRLTGWLSDILPEARLPTFARSPDAKGVGVTLRASGTRVLSPYFDPRLMPLGRIDLVAQISRSKDDHLAVSLSRFTVNGPNVQGTLEGNWQGSASSESGIADMRGTLAQMPVDVLHRFLPNTLSVETRAWLRNALIQGRLGEVTFKVQGDLDKFPFNAPGASGQFLLSGAFHDLSLDYDHGAQDTPGWPLVIGADGTFAIDRMKFAAKARSGRLAGPRGEQVNIDSVDVSIADMELDPQLKVSAQIQGEGDAFVSILRASPAAERLGPGLNAASVTGSLSLAVGVGLNLDLPDNVAVDGSLRFDGNSIVFDNVAPKLESLQGSIKFTDKLVTIDDLRAKALGGEAKASGTLGPGGTGLRIDGTLAAAALLQLADVSDASLFEGKTSYQLRIKEQELGGFDVSATSSLVGLAIGLPAPLGKTAEQRQILSMRWVSTPRRSDFRHAFTLSMGDMLNLRLERYTGVRQGALFQRAALGIGVPVELPESGMIIEASVDRLDWDRWKEQADKLLRVSASTKADPDVFPEIQRARVRATNFTMSDITLKNADLRMTQSQRDQWVATLSSAETDATVSWRESSGALAGRVVAKVSRLSIGEADSGGDEPPKIDSINESQWSDIPAVDLTIDDFVLYGNRLGTVHLQGSNIERGESWNIERLDIRNPHARMSGTGLWKLKGPDRGVRLKATLDVDDLGKLSTYMGYADRVREGSGTLSASVDWRNFPWTFSYEGLDGEARIDFKRGIFEHVNSRSARLLELLSIQSLSRLLRLDFRPGNEFQNGFPFSSITGDFGIAKGVVSTKNLVVASPIAEVLLVGNSDLAHKVWNMQADVKPIFDMSGAAVATGFAVNPLLGLGALVTQFLLRTPIEHVMTSRYSVTGPWDDPKLVPLDGGPANTSGQSNPSEFPARPGPNESGATAPAATGSQPSPPAAASPAPQSTTPGPAAAPQPGNSAGSTGGGTPAQGANPPAGGSRQLVPHLGG